MRFAAVLIGGAVCLGARLSSADDAPAPAPSPAPVSRLPQDGAVAFSYSRAEDVKGCSQPDEAAMRDLVQGVMRVDPFVPAGKTAPFKIAVWVARRRAGVVRGTFELLDGAGVSKGISAVEDGTCDGMHLKLVASIALLLEPRAAASLQAAGAGNEGAGAKDGGDGAVPADGHDAGDRKAGGGAGAAGEKQEAGGPAAKGAVGSGTVAGPGTGAGSGTMAGALPARVGPGKLQPVCKVPLGGYCPPVDIYAVSFSLGGALSLGLTADPGPGAWVAAEIRPIERFSVGFELRGTFPSRVVADIPLDPGQPSESPKEPDWSSIAALIVPCFRYWWAMGCAVGQVGFSIAQSPIDLTALPALAVGPRLGIEIPFAERFFVRAHGDLLVELGGRSVKLPSVNLQWKQPPYSGFLGLGFGVTWR